MTSLSHPGRRSEFVAPYEGKTVRRQRGFQVRLTPQYEGLEQWQKTYDRGGFSVVGFPCNQFAGQEPGTAEEIQTFGSTTYGVTFPPSKKIDVNGEDQSPILRRVNQTATPRATPVTSDGTSRSS